MYKVSNVGGALINAVTSVASLWSQADSVYTIASIMRKTELRIT